MVQSPDEHNALSTAALVMETRLSILLALTALSMLTLIILATMPESTRSQVLGLLGIELSGVEEIAFDKARDIEQLERARSDLEQQVGICACPRTADTDSKESRLEKSAVIEDALTILIQQS